MTKNNIIILRIVSAFFGLSNMLGFVWFGDYYELRPVASIFFEMSTGIALLIFALIPSFLIRNIISRILLILLIIIGGASCIYKIPGHWNLINGPDYGAIILQLVILGVMFAILRYIFKGVKDSTTSRDIKTGD